MNLEKLEKMVKIVIRDLLAEDEKREPKKSAYGGFYGGRTKELWLIPQMEARVKNLMNLAIKTLPEHQHLFTVTHDKINAKYSQLEISDAVSVLRHLLEIIEIEKTSGEKIQAMKIFEGAEEKMKQVNLSFRKEDYNSCFNNLNTALELVLKEKLRIPLTITKVNTAKIVDILVKHKIQPHLYLSEAKKHITDITNKIKHSGYIPSKSDCIFAMKAMEELFAQLKMTEMELSKEVRNKIHEGL
jgi:HEPN domain-containing protein